MKIQITKPTAICITECGSMTERYGIGETVESKDDWMIARLKGVVDSGRATEVQGNAGAEETKAAPKKRVVRKKAPATEE